MDRADGLGYLQDLVNAFGESVVLVGGRTPTGTSDLGASATDPSYRPRNAFQRGQQADVACFFHRCSSVSVT
jgi:hypothetical protein